VDGGAAALAEVKTPNQPLHQTAALLRWLRGIPAFEGRPLLNLGVRSARKVAERLRSSSSHNRNGLKMSPYDIPGEDNYIGVWIGTPSRELRIRKTSPQRYLATLLINGQPLKRPWMNNEPTVDMPARHAVSRSQLPREILRQW
jgi:hypothetical protein